MVRLYPSKPQPLITSGSSTTGPAAFELTCRVFLSFPEEHASAGGMPGRRKPGKRYTT